MQNLNRLTMTVDVDIYDEESQKVEIPAMPGDSPIKVIIYPCLSDCWQVETMRMKRKDYDGILRMPESHTVRVAERLKLIKVLRFFRFFSRSYSGLSQRRRMQPIIYHKVVVNRTYSTINLQIKGFNPYK